MLNKLLSILKATGKAIVATPGAVKRALLTRKALVRTLQVITLSSVFAISYNNYKVYKALTLDQTVKESLVIVVGREGLGSGVVVKSDDGGSWILTNKHVCNLGIPSPEGQLMLDITGWSEVISMDILDVKGIQNQVRSKGQVMKIAQNSDLCLIFTLVPNLPAAKISDHYPQEGDPILNYGNPRGVEGVMGGSEFIGYGLDLGIYSQISKLPIKPGSSGSGVFNTDGELIGLVNAGGFNEFTGETVIAFAVPLQHIKPFVAELGL